MARFAVTALDLTAIGFLTVLAAAFGLIEMGFLAALTEADMGLAAVCFPTLLGAAATGLLLPTRLAAGRLAVTAAASGRTRLGLLAPTALTMRFAAAGVGLFLVRAGLTAEVAFERKGAAAACLRFGDLAAATATVLICFAFAALDETDSAFALGVAARRVEGFFEGFAEAFSFAEATVLISTAISGTTRLARRAGFGVSYDLGLIVESYTF